MTTRQLAAHFARVARETKQPQRFTGWTIHTLYIRHRFGQSLWYRLADRFNVTVVEVQGQDTFARLAAKYIAAPAPEEPRVDFWLGGK